MKSELSNRTSLMIMKGSTTLIIRRAILGSDIMYLVVNKKVQNRIVSIKHIEANSS